MYTPPPDQLLRLRIALDEVQPEVWREIEVSMKISFWQLHVAIQDAMGWTDSHLHEFAVGSSYRGTRIGLPGAATDFSETLPGWRGSVRELLRAPGDRGKYWYDFGDDWRHTVRLEKRLPPAPGVRSATKARAAPTPRLRALSTIAARLICIQAAMTSRSSVEVEVEVKDKVRN